MKKRLPLLIGVAYAVILFGILYVVANGDPFAIFDEGYLMATGVALPALVLTLSAIVLRRREGAFWLPMILLAIWVCAVTLMHFWVVALIAGGV